MQGKTSRWDCVIVADWSGLVRCCSGVFGGVVEGLDLGSVIHRRWNHCGLSES